MDLISGVDSALGEKVGAGVGPDFTGLKDIAQQVKGVVDEQLAKRGVGEPSAGGDGEAAAEGGIGGGGGTARGGGVALSGEIGSREDVVRVLEKICEYYERFEPTSPVPIFMQRAKRLVTMSFVDVIKDLAPEAMSRIEIFTGPSDTPA
jgi:type VI secretion system protein ImpA